MGVRHKFELMARSIKDCLQFPRFFFYSDDVSRKNVFIAIVARIACRSSYEGFSVPLSKPRILLSSEPAISIWHFYQNLDPSAYTIALKITLLFEMVFDTWTHYCPRIQRLLQSVKTKPCSPPKPRLINSLDSLIMEIPDNKQLSNLASVVLSMYVSRQR